MTLRGHFVPDGPIALFLDVDGTLLELAPSPDEVRVPGALRVTLQLAAEREQGALALISGRPLAALDRLFAPSVFPAAGQHGYERRDQRGRVSHAGVEAAALDPLRERLRPWVASHPGLLLEDKGVALALHYRNARKLGDHAQALMQGLADALTPRHRVRSGKCVVEIAPSGCSKRTAIEAFMREPPFRGRMPIFVGDDLTDEEGFEAVNDLGGCSIRVGTQEPSCARYRFASVSGVIAWLRERNTRIMRGAHEAGASAAAGAGLRARGAG